ncbi:MAG: acyl CoA:acetate/3-ketoacid CoA transferase [Acidilobaceae archaeon]|nr:acyl CoA:acetate/3-ketoacid CoA transferase [Acidilobaceae archaeon]
MNKVVDVDEALASIKDGSVVAISGFNVAVLPEYLLLKLYDKYKKTGHPRDLFLIAEAFPGAPGRGIDRIARDMLNTGDFGFIRGLLFPFYGFSEALQKMILENMIEAYSWGLGIVSYWFREVGSGRPGVLTKVGLGSIFDPRREGGALNELARKRRTAVVEIVYVGDERYLLYRAPKPNVALVRGSTADEIGNLTMEDEAVYGTALNIVQATKALPNKGVAIAQVLRLALFGSLRPQYVVIPGPLIDYIVVAPREYHKQTASIDYDPTISGRIIPPPWAPREPKPLDVRKVVARRVLLELVNVVKEEGRPIIINLGIGIPAEVSDLIAEEGLSNYIYSTVESGPWGGVSLHGPDFGAARGPFAILSMPDQFSLYEGGIIDAASLGFLQVDEEGSVNPSMLPGRVPGPGGFPVIADGAPRLIFAGEFTAGSKEIIIRDGEIKIERDGNITKFVKRVYKVIWSGREGIRRGQKVLYVTERAVFRLTEEGLELIEVAPGVDLEKHILSRMEFKPAVKKVDVMDKRIFMNEPMRLREELKGL